MQNYVSPTPLTLNTISIAENNIIGFDFLTPSITNESFNEVIFNDDNLQGTGLTLKNFQFLYASNPSNPSTPVDDFISGKTDFKYIYLSNGNNVIYNLSGGVIPGQENLGGAANYVYVNLGTGNSEVLGTTAPGSMITVSGNTHHDIMNISPDVEFVGLDRDDKLIYDGVVLTGGIHYDKDQTAYYYNYGEGVEYGLNGSGALVITPMWASVFNGIQSLLGMKTIDPSTYVTNYQPYTADDWGTAGITLAGTDAAQSLDASAAARRDRAAQLTLRYRPDAQDALRSVTLSIEAGEVIGFVGQSGSGKSSLTKVIQRLYTPQLGQVMLDGIDVAQLDPGWLRRQIGVVLQENILFNRTIHENIALGDPAMPRVMVMQAAKLAGADEFIAQLPQGYDTMIEERGANLSGGQRQRIAIARALATNPRILILDEATSALDYESERIVQDNMRSIVRGRTVIIIAHRLAAVRPCRRIVGMRGGEIVEVGTPEELLARKDGLYARLWALQSDQARASV